MATTDGTVRATVEVLSAMRDALKWLDRAEQLDREAQSARDEAGRALKAERIAQGQGLAELAQSLGISITYLSDIERGRRRVSAGLHARLRVTQQDERKDEQRSAA
jgi:hypothetical protein